MEVSYICGQILKLTGNAKESKVAVALSFKVESGAHLLIGILYSKKQTEGQAKKQSEEQTKEQARNDKAIDNKQRLLLCYCSCL